MIHPTFESDFIASLRLSAPEEGCSAAARGRAVFLASVTRSTYSEEGAAEAAICLDAFNHDSEKSQPDRLNQEF